VNSQIYSITITDNKTVHVRRRFGGGRFKIYYNVSYTSRMRLFSLMCKFGAECYSKPNSLNLELRDRNPHRK
jgi:hypothetical protein